MHAKFNPYGFYSRAMLDDLVVSITSNSKRISKIRKANSDCDKEELIKRFLSGSLVEMNKQHGRYRVKLEPYEVSYVVEEVLYVSKLATL